MKIYTENIAKYSKVKRQIQTEHGQTEMENMLVKRSLLTEINKKEHSFKVSRTKGRSKGKFLQNFRRPSKLADKVNW